MSLPGKGSNGKELFLESDLQLSSSDMEILRQQGLYQEPNLDPYLEFLEETGAFELRKISAKLFSRSMPVLTLSDLEPGERARVVSVRAATPIRQRLVDMGLLPGVELIMQRVAPFGDPIDIKLKGFHLSLRMIEAEGIAVERC